MGLHGVLVVRSLGNKMNTDAFFSCVMYTVLVVQTVLFQMVFPCILFSLLKDCKWYVDLSRSYSLPYDGL